MNRTWKKRIKLLTLGLALGVVSFVGASVVTLGIVERFSRRFDLTTGIYESRSSKWWGMASRVSTSSTWITEHATPMSSEPVWVGTSGATRGVFAWGSLFPNYTFKFVQLVDEPALRKADDAGLIPDALKQPLADAVRAQWLRIHSDDDDPWWETGQTIGGHLRQWVRDSRALTAEDLDRLIQESMAGEGAMHGD
ncbi:MAG: hypothetical protein AAF937_03405 [Planctomycetota bacterium]